MVNGSPDNAGGSFVHTGLSARQSFLRPPTRHMPHWRSFCVKRRCQNMQKHSTFGAKFRRKNQEQTKTFGACSNKEFPNSLKKHKFQSSNARRSPLQSSPRIRIQFRGTSSPQILALCQLMTSCDRFFSVI